MTQQTSKQSFVQYLKANPTTNGVTPYSMPMVIGIVAGLALVDTVGCVVLIIAGYVFVKKGHQGIGILLALTNCVIPDALPLVDEAIGIVMVVVPAYRGYKKMLAGQANIADVALDVINNSQMYQNNAGNYMNMNGTEIVKTIAEEYATDSEQTSGNSEMPVRPNNISRANSMRNNQRRKF